MGADMVVNYIVIEKGKTVKMVKRELLRKIDELVDSDEMRGKLAIYYDELTGDFDDEAEYDFEEVKEHFREVVSNVLDHLNSREIDFIVHKGDTLFITGGLSWGDDPTDAYSLFREYNLICQIFLEGE